ncbi:hypothetical protein F4775DRAFT_349255 [Biscogniauxia sp. FL1348]|nr:hypothetical protein F4775DRAFT_349255 [Biscogniauxia sp. FL1348]
MLINLLLEMLSLSCWAGRSSLSSSTRSLTVYRFWLQGNQGGPCSLSCISKHIIVPCRLLNNNNNMHPSMLAAEMKADDRQRQGTILGRLNVGLTREEPFSQYCL